MFPFLFLFLSTLLLCSFFRVKELFQVKNVLITSLLLFFVFFFLGGGGGGGGRSDDGKRRKKRGWPNVKKKKKKLGTKKNFFLSLFQMSFLYVRCNCKSTYPVILQSLVAETSSLFKKIM